MNSLTHFAFLWTAVPVKYTRRPHRNELSSLSKRSLHKWKQLKRRYDVRKYQEACRCRKTRISYWSAKLSAHRFSWRFRRIIFIAVECSSQTIDAFSVGFRNGMREIVQTLGVVFFVAKFEDLSLANNCFTSNVPANSRKTRVSSQIRHQRLQWSLAPDRSESLQ